MIVGKHFSHVYTRDVVFVAVFGNVFLYIAVGFAELVLSYHQLCRDECVFDVALVFYLFGNLLCALYVFVHEHSQSGIEAAGSRCAGVEVQAQLNGLARLFVLVVLMIVFGNVGYLVAVEQACFLAVDVVLVLSEYLLKFLTAIVFFHSFGTGWDSSVGIIAWLSPLPMCLSGPRSC